MSNVRLRRLAADFERMQSYVRRHPRVKLIQVEGSPPEKYQLQYVVRSLRQIGGELKDADSHMVEIVLPRNYPRTPPQCRMLTPVFHPNVAPHAICVGDHWGAGEPLESIVVRIGEMLAYQSYNVKSPLNGDAARWVEQNLDRIPTDKVSMLAEEYPEQADAAGMNGAAAVAPAAAVSTHPAPPPADVYGVGAPGQFAPPQAAPQPSPRFPQLGIPQPPFPQQPFPQQGYAPQPPQQFSPQPFPQQPFPQQPVGPPPAARPQPPPAQQPSAAPAAPSVAPPAAVEKIKVSCPGCGKTYVVPAVNRGRTAKCQNCQHSFTL